MQSTPFCLMCDEGVPRCPTCCYQGERLLLDEDQTSSLFDAVYSLKENKSSYTREQLQDALTEFRNLLDEWASWYDKESRQMIQACYQNLCMRGGTSNRVGLALHFFKEEFERTAVVQA